MSRASKALQAGKHILQRFQELCYWVREELRVKEAILDGEVVALDPQGRQDFRGLLAGRGNLHYMAFDALWINGKDLRAFPLTRRKRALGRLIWATSMVLSQVFSVEERGQDLFAAAERLDLEGIVAKRKVDPYAPETVWFKVKNRAYTQGEPPPLCTDRNEPGLAAASAPDLFDQPFLRCKDNFILASSSTHRLSVKIEVRPGGELCPY